MADLAPGAGGAAERALSEGGEIESLGELQPGSPGLGGSDGSEIVEIVHPDDDEDYEITEGEEEDVEEESSDGEGGPSGQGFGAAAEGAGQEGITLYIPGIGNVPLSSLGSLTQQLRRGPGRPAAQQDPAEKSWSSLTQLPEATQDASSTVNSLLGERAATVSSFQPTGLKPVVYTRTLPDGFALRLIDTPSPLERDAVSRARLEEIAAAVDQAGGGVDATLFLDRLDAYAPDRADGDLVDALTAFFGVQLWDRAVIGLTRATEAAPPPGEAFATWVAARTRQVEALIAGANEAGEKLVPGEVAWVTRLYQELAYLVATTGAPPFVPDLAAAERAANPDRRRKWLIPLVIALQIGAKLVLDRVMEMDEAEGDEDGPFDKETREARKRALRERKKAARAASKDLKLNKAAAKSELEQLLDASDEVDGDSDDEDYPSEP
ncbi:hypothetical protein QBZ16_002283 [Prototheca wickerhamii]|uniref:AIG1-type G domain-containing protein n=1 Tax=Prototheca wickerhamii TaxID=3111 RepID=A0AAD9ILN7_PROWI|nr:hypothetical protein QBZ16_002283 [Prototheca wickerhamii]